jgi:CheY-like chemotaxis protein
MDLRMPIMTGYEATLAIRSSDRKDRNIPIIAMTADAFSQDIQHCLEMGMNGHVAKPIDIKEVTRLLERFI